MKLLNRKFVLLTIIATIVTLSLVCRAQNQEPVGSAIEVARANMEADRATIIGGAMNFSDKDASAFWPIYRQYEYERSTLEDRRVAVIKEYTAKFSTLTDADAKSMTETMFEYDSGLVALKKRYFKRFNKVLPALTVTKFFQLDRRLDLLIDMKLESAVPSLAQAQYAGEEK